MKDRKDVILLSGGIDSTICLGKAKVLAKNGTIDPALEGDAAR